MPTFDASKYKLTFGAIAIEARADAGIVVARDEPVFTKVSDSSGKATRSKSNNKGGTITFNVLQTDTTNELLSAWLLADEEANSGVVPTTITNMSTGESVTAPNSWLRGWPEFTVGKEAGVLTWIIECETVLPFIKGSASWEG